MKRLALSVAVSILCCGFALGQAQEKVLWSFGSVPNDGIGPQGALVSDSSGNLYGATTGGGANGYGILFELSPQLGGTWIETILYNFCSNFVNELCLDGAAPAGSLAFDSQRNLYGVAGGGTGSSCGLS